MGCCLSAERVEEKQRHHEIETQIKRDRDHLKSEIKMLLLGKCYWLVCLVGGHHEVEGWVVKRWCERTNRDLKNILN